MTRVGLAPRRKMGEEILTDSCPFCASAPLANPGATRKTTTLILVEHPACHACRVLMGPGHVEASLNKYCSWCDGQGNRRPRRASRWGY
jgi:hypothetical protein